MKNFIIMRNLFGRWIIVNPLNRLFGWSGSRWVEMSKRGFSIQTQLCNFDTASEAATFAEKSAEPQTELKG